MRHTKWRAWDKQAQKFFEPTYAAYMGELEELLLSQGGRLSVRTLEGTADESIFPNRFEFNLSSALTDSAGVEVYHKDILRLPDGTHGIVELGDYLDRASGVWHYGFYVEAPDAQVSLLLSGYEVVGTVEGNAYQNIELLKESQA